AVVVEIQKSLKLEQATPRKKGLEKGSTSPSDAITIVAHASSTCYLAVQEPIVGSICGANGFWIRAVVVEIQKSLKLEPATPRQKIGRASCRKSVKAYTKDAPGTKKCLLVVEGPVVGMICGAKGVW